MISESHQREEPAEEQAELSYEGETKLSALKSFPVIILAAVLLFFVTLAFSFYLAPGLVTFFELTAGLFASTELIVRIYFFLMTAQWMLIILFLLQVKPVSGLRQRLILYFLLAEGAVLCTVWLFDDLEKLFRSEGSSLTFFTSIVLVLCTAGAFTNLFLVRMKKGVRMQTLFWGLLSAAFLFASVDEFFKIHEQLATLIRATNFGEDMLTAAYAVGAVVVSALFYKSLRHDLFNWNRWFFRLFLTATVLLGAAIFFDTADIVFQYFFRDIFDVNHLSNSLEELLEFTAACLYCCAFIVCIAEADDGRILHKAEECIRPFQVSGFIKAAVGVIILCLIAFLVAIRTVFGGADDRILAQDNCPVVRIAGNRSGLNGPDGLLFHPDFGMIVCNEYTGSLIAFSPNGERHHIVEPGRGLMSPEGLAIGKEGLIVSDDSQGKIFLYTAAGGDLVELYSDGLRSPEGLAVDKQNRLHIADEKLSAVMRQAGDQRDVLASSADGLQTPEEMVFDDKGNLYVTDESACAVFRISPDGAFSRFADADDGLHRPEGITFHQGCLYVTDDLAGLVFRFDTDGNGHAILTFGRHYRRICGIAFDDKGFLYVVARDPCSNSAWLLRIDIRDGDPITAYDDTAVSVPDQRIL